MRSRRFSWSCAIVLVVCLLGCGSVEKGPRRRLTIGVVTYGEGRQTLQQFADLQKHLETSLKSLIEVEPALNERQALQQIKRKNWDVVFATPGLAAIAISQSQYTPLLPQAVGAKATSVIVVLDDSSAQTLDDLENQALALGQRGSATGYYFPVYNLYGTTLSEVKFASTPKAVLQLLQEGVVAAGALSAAELDKYRSQFSQAKFRILFRDTHDVPSGAVLVAPTLDSDVQNDIRAALKSAGSPVAAAAGYVTNATPPDYSYMIEVVERVDPIAQRINEKPAPLYERP